MDDLFKKSDDIKMDVEDISTETKASDKKSDDDEHDNKKNDVTRVSKKRKAGIGYRVVEAIKDFQHIIVENKAISITVLIFVVLAIVGLVFANNLAHKKETSVIPTEVTDNLGTDGIVIDETPMELNMYPDVNALIKKYYVALSTGDVDTITTIKSDLDDKEKIKIEKKSEYIDDYPTIDIYTKKGPEADSFVVYVYYQVKFNEYDTPAPGLNTFYVVRDSDGIYVIKDGELDDSVVEYLKYVSASDEVIDLFNKVQVEYNDVKKSDEKLSLFLDELPDILTAQVGEALAGLTTPVVDESQVESETTPEDILVEGTTKVRATDVVNIRVSDSETADKLGKAQLGEEFVLLETKANGWSKIEYQGGAAYIKSQYLEQLSSTTSESDTANEDANPTEDNTDTASTATSGTNRLVTTTVNIRSSASTSSDKLGTLYQGDKIEVVMDRADGWSEVLYKGKRGYIKSEFLD